MSQNTLVITGIALLATGTYLLRLAGVKLGSRLVLTENSRALIADAATTLLLSVAVIATLLEGQDFAGFARLAGVGVATILAWRKVPLIVVILAAAAVTAALRWLGIS